MDRLIYTLEIYTYNDYLFDGFSVLTNRSTKSYLETALTTPTQSDRSVASGRSSEAFHQHNRSILGSYILLDNQYIVDILCNPTLLCNICAS